MIKVKEFLDTKGSSAHDRFQQWRTRHQDGVFLTLNTRTQANLHGARCTHLGSGPPYFSSTDGHGSLTSTRKLCASDPELLAWAVKNGVTVNRCQQCDRAGFLGAIPPPHPPPGRPDAADRPEELIGIEGALLRRLTIHRRREWKLRKAKIAEALTKGRLRCGVPGCRFDFERTYGALGRGYAQVHHVRPLSDRDENSRIKLSDLAVVCANCHAMIHRGGKCRKMDRLITNT